MNLMPRHRKSNKRHTDWLHSRAFQCYLLSRPSAPVITPVQTSLQCDAGLSDGPSHPSLCLYHWLQRSAHMFAFHIVTAAYCKSDSLLQPGFILYLCLLSPRRIFMRPWSSIRPQTGDYCELPFSLSVSLIQAAVDWWVSQWFYLQLLLHLLPINVCIYHNKVFQCVCLADKL